MTALSDLVPLFARCENPSQSYLYQMAKSAEYLAREIGNADCETITEDQLNAHLRNMIATGVSSDYVSLRKRCLARLLDFAAEQGLRKPLDRRALIRVKRRRTLTDGFTVNEARRLLRAAAAMTGRHRDGVLRCLYWDSAVRIMWDTGIAGNDLRRLKMTTIADDHMVRHAFQIQRSKTGAPKLCKLHESTRQSVAVYLAHLISLNRATEKPWKLWGRYVSDWRREARQLIRSTGLTGSMKYLRSGSGSEVEADSPGMGCRHLANTQSVFEQSYRVPRIVDRNMPMPPELEL